MDETDEKAVRPRRPFPQTLLKHGITSVTHNLLPGQEVNWVKPLFWVFRGELEDRLIKPLPKTDGGKGDGDGNPTL